MLRCSSEVARPSSASQCSDASSGSAPAPAAPCGSARRPRRARAPPHARRRAPRSTSRPARRRRCPARPVVTGEPAGAGAGLLERLGGQQVQPRGAAPGQRRVERAAEQLVRERVPVDLLARLEHATSQRGLDRRQHRPQLGEAIDSSCPSRNSSPSTAAVASVSATPGGSVWSRRPRISLIGSGTRMASSAAATSPESPAAAESSGRTCSIRNGLPRVAACSARPRAAPARAPRSPPRRGRRAGCA